MELGRKGICKINFYCCLSVSSVWWVPHRPQLFGDMYPFSAVAFIHQMIHQMIHHLLYPPGRGSLALQARISFVGYRVGQFHFWGLAILVCILQPSIARSLIFSSSIEVEDSQQAGYLGSINPTRVSWAFSAKTVELWLGRPSLMTSIYMLHVMQVGSCILNLSNSHMYILSSHFLHLWHPIQIRVSYMEKELQPQALWFSQIK